MSNNNFTVLQYGIPLLENKYSVDYKQQIFSTLEPDIILYVNKLFDWSFCLGNRAVLINNENVIDILITCLNECHIISNNSFRLSCGDNCIITTPILNKTYILDNTVVELDNGNIKKISMNDVNREEYYHKTGIYNSLVKDPFIKRRNK